MEIEESLTTLNILLDSKYPLLQKFREACPGSYKHSQYLESMIEGVAIELNLNTELMKVAALYHDIGKMFNPKYFTENQTDKNPHDELSPIISYELITRHVSDSVIILLNDSNFPREIIEIISQHHGTSLVKYFYSKYVSMENAVVSTDKIEEDKNFYRYKTTKPTTVESALLMICDQIEAISRSHINMGKFDAELVVNKTLNELIDDGQLDEVTIKLGDLSKIKRSLLRELEGMAQNRIPYPDDKKAQ